MAGAGVAAAMALRASILLHGSVGSWDELAWGALLAVVLIIDSWVILQVWRAPLPPRSKWLWSLLVFFLHVAGWIAFYLSRSLDERRPPPTDRR